MKSKLIVLEGGEGAGKSTQIELLKKYCDPTITEFTREPGGTLLGEQLRAFILNNEMSAESELINFLSARSVLMERVVRPALAKGKTVISDRFGLSTIAYQIYGRERQDLLPLLLQLSKGIVREVQPFYVLLDIDPEIGIERASRRGEMNRLDAENIAFHHRVREGYLAHYDTLGAGVRIDASQPVEEVARDIQHVLGRFC